MPLTPVIRVSPEKVCDQCAVTRRDYHDAVPFRETRHNLRYALIRRGAPAIGRDHSGKGVLDRLCDTHGNVCRSERLEPVAVVEGDDVFAAGQLGEPVCYQNRRYDPAEDVERIGDDPVVVEHDELALRATSGATLPALEGPLSFHT